MAVVAGAAIRPVGAVKFVAGAATGELGAVGVAAETGTANLVSKGRAKLGMNCSIKAATAETGGAAADVPKKRNTPPNCRLKTLWRHRSDR